MFKKQISKNKFSEDLIRVESAFGGIGLYKINKNKNYLYETKDIDTEFYSEHLSFNNNFKKFIYRQKLGRSSTGRAH